MRCCSIEPRDHIILAKIISYCDRIAANLERYQNDYDAFTTDYLFQDACCMCIVQIGELVSQLSESVKEQNAVVPWRVIKDTRNFYVHNYGSIDIPSVWNTMNYDIPELKAACMRILGK